MSFSAEEYFTGLNMFGIRLGLDATRELLRRAGNPEKGIRFLHLAGTNGKGSTGAILERTLRRAGLRTGFYTSPHLIDTRERFRIDGKAVTTAEFNRAAAELAEAARGGNFSYFEFATVLAAKLFQEHRVDVAVWETGMGGRLDATNAVATEAAIITNIAFDHENRLGHTLAAIAGEKAGIIKPGKPVFCGFLPREAQDTVSKKAAELGSSLFNSTAPAALAAFFERDGRLLQRFVHDGHEIELALPGVMQRRNFALAYEVLKYFAPRWNFDLETALSGTTLVKWPARCQRLSERLVIDGGHNPDGVAALVEALRELENERKFTVVYGAFKDKAYPECVRLLSSLAKRFVFTPLAADGRPSVPPAELKRLAAQYGIPAEGADNAAAAVRAALASGPEEVLASGSLFLAGELLSAFAPPEAVLDL